MDMGCNSAKQTTIEQLSEQVKGGVKDIRFMMEEFYEPSPNTGGIKDCPPSPSLPALKQIEDNLVLTNQMIKSSIELFQKIKNQIR